MKTRSNPGPIGVDPGGWFAQALVLVLFLMPIFGAFFAAAGIAASGAVAWFYAEPQVRLLAAVLSVGFLVNALGATQEALLVREMRFRSLELKLSSSLPTGDIGMSGQVTLDALDLAALLFVGSAGRRLQIQDGRIALAEHAS